MERSAEDIEMNISKMQLGEAKRIDAQLAHCKHETDENPMRRKTNEMNFSFRSMMRHQSSQNSVVFTIAFYQ